MSRRSLRWLLPISALLTLAGYFGAWVDHAVVGLVIAGLDLGEYVKFLPQVRSGEIVLWREGFYLPLFAVSLALSLHAFRAEFAYHWLARAGLLVVSGVAALNMLPPAWSPPLLVTPEFRLQTAAIAMCLGALLISPMLALLPRLAVGVICAVLAAAALWWPVGGFVRVLESISMVYLHDLAPGWGMYTLVIGLVLLGGVSLINGIGRDG